MSFRRNEEEGFAGHQMMGFIHEHLRAIQHELSGRLTQKQRAELLVRHNEFDRWANIVRGVLAKDFLESRNAVEVVSDLVNETWR